MFCTTLPTLGGIPNGASWVSPYPHPYPTSLHSHRAAKGTSRDMQVFIFSTVFRGAQIQHTSAADRLSIVRLCSSGHTTEISSEDRGWQTALFSIWSSPNWNTSSLSHTHTVTHSETYIQTWKAHIEFTQCVIFKIDIDMTSVSLTLTTIVFVKVEMHPRRH